MINGKLLNRTRAKTRPSVIQALVARTRKVQQRSRYQLDSNQERSMSNRNRDNQSRQ